MEGEIDLGQAMGLADAAKLMRGRGGKAPSIETLRRWASPNRGCWPKGRAGPQLLLMTVRVNGELLTCRAWVEKFEKERARLGARQAPLPSELPRPEGRRRKAHERAEQYLDRMGIGRGGGGSGHGPLS